MGDHEFGICRVLGQNSKFSSVINGDVSSVSLQIQTDLGKSIRQERVILLAPDGSTYEEKTDDQGHVSFSISFPPSTAVFIVLPDILEHWGGNDWESYIQDFSPSTEDPRLDQFKGRHKDYIDNMRNKPERITSGQDFWEDDYRSWDITKYKVLTQDIGSAQTTLIKVNKLTEDEKFRHFQDVLESNNAWYDGSNMPNYDPNLHLWTLKSGCVCNQLMNIFLGFWFNHNSAFTTIASMTDFLTIMDKVSSKLNTVSIRIGKDKKTGNDKFIPIVIRGFSDVRHAAIEPPTGMDFERYKEYYYIRTDKDAWDVENSCFKSNDLMSCLEKFNIYSIWDGADPNNTRKPHPHKVDHHGGLLIKEDIWGWLKKLSADGSKKDGKYSNTLIKYKEFNDPVKLKNLHLRIWPLKRLRPGGYAPAQYSDELKSQPLGDYLADQEMSEKPDIIFDFPHSVPRFIKWIGHPNKIT